MASFQTLCSIPATCLRTTRAPSSRESKRRSVDQRSPRSEPALSQDSRDYPNYSPHPAARSTPAQNERRVRPTSAPTNSAARNPPSPACPCHKQDRKSTRLNSSHLVISYAVFCLKKKKNKTSN